MTPRYATATELRRALSTEMLEAAGLSRLGPLQALFKPLVWLPTHRFARLAAEFDRRVAQSGFIAAARWVLPRFVDDVQAFGVEHIPTQGPLVIASNHPGSYDALTITSVFPRDDLKIIVTGRPFFRSMYASSPHFIYTPFDTQTHERMTVVRESIRHLQAGGSLLMFPNGQVEPDPAVLPGAHDTLPQWSPSLPLLLRRVPETNLLVTIVSGVLAPSCLRHPLTRLRKEQQPKQVLAEFLQVSQQMAFGRRFGLTPKVRFASPFKATELGATRDAQTVLAAVIARAQRLLADVQSQQPI